MSIFASEGVMGFDLLKAEKHFGFVFRRILFRFKVFESFEASKQLSLFTIVIEVFYLKGELYVDMGF
jgi:hypothetical protein